MLARRRDTKLPYSAQRQASRRGWPPPVLRLGQPLARREKGAELGYDYQIGRDPADLRRQNLIAAFPHRTAMS